VEPENLNRRGGAARTPHWALDEAESFETKRTKKLTFPEMGYGSRRIKTDQSRIRSVTIRRIRFVVHLPAKVRNYPFPIGVNLSGSPL
jgi:hypothetical protein